MTLKYLGTGSSEGIPSLFCDCNVCKYAREHRGRDMRHRTSALIDNDLLIDLSPDTFSQAMSLELNLSQLKYLIITHTHADHFYIRELMNLVPPFSRRSATSKLQILSSSFVLSEIKNELTSDDYVKLSEYVEWIELKPFTPHSTGNYTITPLKARHSTVMPFIYIIEKDGRKLLYANDSGFFPEDTWDYMSGIYLDFISLDCTHLTECGTTGHMCIEDDVTTKKRMFQQNNVDSRSRFAATHFSHNGGLNYFEIDERLRLYGIITAYDGLEIKW